MWSSDLKYGPPARDWGSCVSGLVPSTAAAALVLLPTSTVSTFYSAFVSHTTITSIIQSSVSWLSIGHVLSFFPSSRTFIFIFFTSCIASPFLSCSICRTSGLSCRVALLLWYNGSTFLNFVFLLFVLLLYLFHRLLHLFHLLLHLLYLLHLLWHLPLDSFFRICFFSLTFLCFLFSCFCFSFCFSSFLRGYKSDFG